MDSQNSATQAWCCVHQQLGCPSSSDPEDFDCSVLTDWRSPTRSWNGGGHENFLWRFKNQILGDYLRFDSFLGDFFFWKENCPWTKGVVSCLLCWMAFTKITRYFFKKLFVRFSSVLVAPESWQISGKSPERSKLKNKKCIYILGGFSGGWYLFESLLDWFIQKIVKNVSYCWYTKLIHLHSLPGMY